VLTRSASGMYCGRCTFLPGTSSWASLSGTRSRRGDLEQTRVFKASLRSEFFSMESHDRTLAYLVGL
jgi:hypothetical protein